MAQKLIYIVAAHAFAIETSDAVLTKQRLPNYSEFEAPHDTKIPETELLFRFTGAGSISLPPQHTHLEEISYTDTVTNIYKTDDGYFLVSRVDEKTRYMSISADFRTFVTDVSTTDASDEFFLNCFVTLAYGFAIIPYNTIKVHASVIEKNGRALLFLGKSGTGKSTHSRLWQQYVPGSTLLNDDSPIVRYYKEDGRVVVYGSPWSGKTPCYRNISAKVAAFVHLHQSKENHMSRLPVTEGLSSLLFSSAMFRSEAGSKAKVLDTLIGILESVPVYRLDCRPDEEAVRLTETLMT